MLEEKLINFFNSPIGQQFTSQHTNDGVIGGLLVNRPKENDYQRPNKVKGMSFILHQPKKLKIGNDMVDTTFLMMTYNEKVIDILKSLDKIAYVMCRFSIHYRPRAKGYYPLVHSVEIVYRFEDDLEETL